MEKVKLRETAVYQEYDRSRIMLEHFVGENRDAIVKLSFLAQEDPSGVVAKDPILIRFAELENDMNSKLNAYSNYVQEVYLKWMEELKTADVSEPGKSSYNALADALLEQEKFATADEQKRKELEAEVKRRRDILNIVFETHIAEF